MNKYMTEAELQHIEHCNKILREHEEVISKVINSTETMLNTYIPILQGYVSAVADIQKHFGQVSVDIIRSTRELKVITSGSQELHNYTIAAEKLNNTLSDELVQKIVKLTKE